MLEPSTKFSEEIRAYQIHTLNFGKCHLCTRGLTAGDAIYVGEKSDGTLDVACESCKNQLNRVFKQFVFHPRKYHLPSKDALLWRYQDFPKFVSLLDSGNLFFTRADKFFDVFECARGFNFQKDDIYQSMKIPLTLSVKRALRSEGNENPSEDEIETRLKLETEKVIEEQQNKRKDYFVSCWHNNERESEAMWKLYVSAKDQGIAIQTTTERLCYSLGKTGFDIGEVNYISYEKPLGVDDEPIWYKRTAFSHEREVRVVYKDAGSSKTGLPIAVDLDMLIEKVYVSPSAPVWFTELVRSVMEKYGLNKSVEQSKLDASPIY